jgi:hypothetical protein
MTIQYQAFINVKDGSVGVVDSDENILTVDQYSALNEDGNPTFLELLSATLQEDKKAIELLKKHILLLEDPEWNIKEVLVFNDIVLDRHYKSDWKEKESDEEILPGITLKEIAENTAEHLDLYAPESTGAAQAVNEIVQDIKAQGVRKALNSHKVLGISVGVILLLVGIIFLIVMSREDVYDAMEVGNFDKYTKDTSRQIEDLAKRGEKSPTYAVYKLQNIINKLKKLLSEDISGSEKKTLKELLAKAEKCKSDLTAK